MGPVFSLGSLLHVGHRGERALVDGTHLPGFTRVVVTLGSSRQYLPSTIRGRCGHLASLLVGVVVRASYLP